MARPYESGLTRRSQIAEAALRLLSEEGFGAVTTRKVAARVGLTEGALFRHFDNKQAMMLACLDHLETLMFAAAPDALADPLERLERFFRRRVMLVAGPTALGHLIFSEQLVHATGEEGRERIKAWRERSASFVRSTLEALAKQGRLREGLTPDALVQVVQGLVLGFVAERAVSGFNESTLPRLIDQAWKTVCTVVLQPSKQDA